MEENDFIIYLFGGSDYGMLATYRKFQDAFEIAKIISEQIIFFGPNIKNEGMNILKAINKWFDYDK